MLIKIAFILLFLIKANTGEDSWEEKNKKLHKHEWHYEKFQDVCSGQLDDRIRTALHSSLHDVESEFKFLAPCEECRIGDLDFFVIDENTVQGKFIADDLFQTIFTLPVTSYLVNCACSKAVTKKGIDDSLAQMMRQHASDKCNKVQLNYTHNMDPEKVKKCFLELDPNHDGKNVESEKLSMKGKDVFINITTVAHVHDTDVKIIYKDITVMSPPRPICDDTRIKDQEFCQCLEQGGFFANLPLLMLNNFLGCDAADKKKSKFLNHISHSLQCKDDVDKFL